MFNERDLPGRITQPATTAGTPEVAVELYAASLLAIEVDRPAERDYLRRLAQRLNLTPATVRRVHQALDMSATA